MTQLASVLRAEIVRVARKEARAEIESLKKASTQHRSAIAQLRRQVTELQKQLRQADRQTARQMAAASRTAASGAPTAAGAPEATPRRFSASRLAAHRAKLGLSAAAYGQLVGIGGQTIYNWEQGKSRPNAQQLQRLAAVRALGKLAVQEKLARRP